MENPLPLITIVTPSFNQGRFLEKTILSVIHQNYPNLEYIIMDGGSTDGSVEIIKKYSKHLSYWQSKPDGGQSTALNEAFKMAKGSILGWINSDDMLAEDALMSVGKWFINNKEKNWLIGGTVTVDENENIFYGSYQIPLINFGTNAGYLELLYFGNTFNQSSCFFRKDFYIEVGGINTSFNFSFDYDLFLKFARKEKSGRIKNILSFFRYHALSKSSTQKNIQAEEDRKICQFNRRKRLYYIFLYKYFLTKYYFRKMRNYFLDQKELSSYKICN